MLSLQELSGVIPQASWNCTLTFYVSRFTFYVTLQGREPVKLRLWVGILVAVCFAQAAHGAEQRPRRFGKSHAQILAMGVERWMDFQGAKAGQSTAGMTEGMMAYRDALRWRNDRLATKAPAARRADVAKLRPLLVRYTDGMMTVGHYMTGGGTIWSNIHAGALSDSEEVLYHLLAGGGKAPHPTTTGPILRQLAALEQDMADVAKERNTTKAELDYVRADLKKARTAFTGITQIAARFDRRRSDRVLDFCLDMAETAAGGERAPE